jgi:NitT/TauT family transport system permease protein
MASSEPRRRRGTLRYLADAWPVPLFFAAFFVFWQQSIGWFDIPPYILPKPTDIVLNAWPDAPRLLEYSWVTGLETVLGYVVALVIAVPLGLAIADSSVLRRTLYPFLAALEMTPKIAFAPLFISWLGFGLLPKVIIVFLVCFFPIVLNAVMAFGSLPEELARFVRSTGAGYWRAFWRVRLPAALPQCFVGFKYGAMNATVGATIAEFIGSDRGLGFYISIVTGNMRPDLAFAGIFLLTILGLALFGAVTLAERLLIPWHISQRRMQ